MIPDSNLKAYEEIKNSGKGNYIGKHKSQYYCNFGVKIVFYLLYDPTTNV